MAKGGTPRVTKAEHARRVDEIETLLARRLSTSRIERWGADKWGVSQRQIRNYIRAVRDRWEEESKGTDRTAKRDQLRATAEDIVARALSRTEVVRDAAGNPVIITNPDGSTKIATREVPDLKTAVRGSDVLARLDGLYQDRLKVDAQVKGAIAAAVSPTPERFRGRTREELAHFARTGRFPDSDQATG